MISISEYDISSGKIEWVKSFSDQESYELNNSIPHVFGLFDRDLYFIKDGQPTERPAPPVRLTGLTLQGVPAGSTLTIASASLSTSNGERYEAEGEIELEFPLPGSYSLQVECWPYKDWEGEVVVPVVSGVES
jgi:hypothetical protein